MNIKKFAELTNTNQRTIRFYEEKGLLTPIRQENGYRQFQDSDVADMKFILMLKMVNVTLEDIATILSLKRRHTSIVCKEETLTFLDCQIEQLFNMLYYSWK